MHGELDELLLAAVTSGLTPGCAALVWRRGELAYEGYHGVLGRHGLTPAQQRPVGAGTVYDLASLTKVLSTTSLTALAVGRGELRLDERLPGELAVGPAGLRPRLRDLLEHASGLAAHREFFHAPWSLDLGARRELVAAIRELAPETAPRERAIYTDLGFILLGAWLERHGGATLDRLFRDQLAAPLGLEGEVFYGGAAPLAHPEVAPTEVYDPVLHGGVAQTWYALRQRAGQGVARGLVHDDNCLVMGGVAGHAGLFGTARGVLGLARAWLERRLPGLAPEASAAVWDEFTAPSEVPGSTRRLGFDGPNPDGSGSTGAALSPAAVGHLGYTGTSVWIDPGPGPGSERAGGSIYVLLTNRVHPTRDEPRIRDLRRRFHELAARGL